MRKLILIFSLLFAVSFAQVPNTTTFTLWDVQSNVALSAGDLVDCFAKSVSDKFDPSYDNILYAPANSMKRFRNYNNFVTINWSFEYTTTYAGGLQIWYDDIYGSSHFIVNITADDYGTVKAPIGSTLHVFVYGAYPNGTENLSMLNPSHSDSGHYGLTYSFLITSATTMTVVGGYAP